MGSGGGGSTTTVQQSDPWSGQQPYLQDLFKLARENLTNEAAGRGASYYPNRTYTPMTEQTASGLSALRNRAVQSGVTDAVPAEQALAQQATGLLNQGAATLPGYQSQLNVGNTLATRGAASQPGYSALADTAAGNMIGRNPEFQGMVDRAIAAARPGVDSAFAGAGRLGSGAHAAAFSDAAANVAGNLAYQDYAAERQNQLNAAQTLGQQDIAARTLGLGTLSGLGQQDLAAQTLGGQFSQASTANDLTAIQNMISQGQAIEGYQDKALTDAINRWNYNQNRPFDLLQRYGSLIQGNYGNTQTLTQPITGPSQAASALSGAASGAAIGTSIYPGWGTAIGAIGGGLYGLLA